MTTSALSLAEADALIEQLAVAENVRVPEPGRRVWVNRDLRMDRIALVGFDMDHTIAVYHKQPIETLAYQLTVQKLVQKRGYPEELLALEYNPSFVIQGLVVDKQTGNLFKLDRYGHVGIVFHGMHRMDKTERRAAYRAHRISFDDPRYALIDTAFGLPEACLYAQLIDYFEQHKAGHAFDTWEIFDDVRNCIDEAHRDDTLKSVVTRDLARFIRKDPELAATLHRLRSAGKKLFLLTNSLWAYTQQVMSYLLDKELADYPSWRNYFDIVSVGAKKPDFFLKDEPFVELDERGDVVAERSSTLQRGRIYQGGNVRAFEEQSGFHGESVLYVGDHIYGDILRLKKASTWRNAIIVEELEREVGIITERADDFARLGALDESRSTLDSQLVHVRTLLAALNRADAMPEDQRLGVRMELLRRRDDVKRKLETTLAELSEIEHALASAFNEYWGMTFKCGRENSRYGSQVEDYACIYTSRVTNLNLYSPMSYFRGPRALMAHEWPR